MTVGGGITAVVALSMGLRHGLDADHLAVVDSLARQRASGRCSSAAWTGVLFALGHVAVIGALAIVLSLTSASLDPPPWLGAVGSLIASATLLLLGVLNVRAGLRRGAAESFYVAGLRSRLLACRSRSTWQVLGIGALFAVSLDALALAGLFAGAGGRISGAAVAAGLFACGMVAVSAVNGLWVARLLRDRVVASSGAARVLALTIGAASLAVGAWILLGVAGGSESPIEISDFAMSLFVICIVAIGYGTALCISGMTLRSFECDE